MERGDRGPTGNHVVAHHQGCHPCRHAVAGRALPRLQASSAVDIRTVDRHPLTTVNSLVIGLRCSMCRDGAPMPELRGLQAFPPAARYMLS